MIAYKNELNDVKLGGGILTVNIFHGKSCKHSVYIDKLGTRVLIYKPQ